MLTFFKIFFVLTILAIFLLLDTSKDTLQFNNAETVENMAIDSTNIKYLKFADINPDSTIWYLQKRLTASIIASDSNKIASTLLLLSNAFYIAADYDSALKLLIEAKTIHNAIENDIGSAICDLQLAHYHYNSSKFQISKKLVSNSLEIFNHYSYKDGIRNSNFLLSYLNSVEANYVLAYRNIFEFYKLTDERNDENLMCALFLQMGDINNFLGNYQLALDKYRRGIEICDKYGKIGHAAILNLSLCNLYTKMSEFDSARFYGQKAHNLYVKSKHKNGLASLLKTLGQLSFKEENYSEAFNYYKDALEIAENLSHTWLISEISQNLADLYITQKKYAKASTNLDRSFALARDMGAKDLILNCYQSYSNLYEKSNNHKMALHYHQLYSNLRDSLFVINQSEITNLQVDYYTEKVQKEKELLQKNNSILFLEAEKQKLLNMRLLYGFIILGLISIIIFLLYQRKIYLNKILENNMNQAMLEQYEQNQIIMHQAGLASLGELVASVAHDVNQPLQNIGFCLENIDMVNKSSEHENTKISQNILEIDSLLDRIKNIIDHIRLFSSRQKEDIYQEFSINHSIENAYHMLERKFRRERIAIILDLSEEIPDAIGNPYKFEQVIINLLSNSRDATIAKKKLSVNGYIPHIKIQTFHNVDEIIIKIIDNGIGITKENQEQIFLPFFSTKKLGEGQGLGLTISARLLKEFKANINLKSETSIGTITTVSLPIQNSTA